MFAFLHWTFAFISTKCASRVLLLLLLQIQYRNLLRAQHQHQQHSTSQHCRIDNFELLSTGKSALNENVKHFQCSFYGKTKRLNGRLRSIFWQHNMHILLSIFKRDTQLFINLFLLFQTILHWIWQIKAISTNNKSSENLRRKIYVKLPNHFPKTDLGMWIEIEPDNS